MYNQLLYFIIALLLFDIEQPGNEPFLPLWETVFLGVSCFLCYGLTCYLALRRLGHAVAEDSWHATPLMSRYLAVQRRLSILALVNLAIDVYALGIKYYLQGGLPGLKQSLTLQGIAVLGLLLVHFGLIWFWSYPIYRRIHQSNMTRGAFLWGNLAFSTAILVPWVLISIISDVLEMVKSPAFLKTEPGQFVLMGSLMIGLVLFAPRLVVRLWGCRALPVSAERMALENFAEDHHFKVGNFMLWPLFGGEMLTAGILGILPKWRYILVTRGLLRLLNLDELKAVLAHEIGHVRRYHMLFYLAFFLCSSILAYALSDIALLILLRNPVILEWALDLGSANATLLSALTSVPIIFIFLVYFRVIFGFYMRNSERQADLYALQLIGHPFSLVSSLQKIGVYSGHTHDVPSWHHYSIRQRIEFLLGAYEDPALIRRHHQKYYRAMVVFFVLVAGLSTLGFNLDSNKVARKWRMEMQVTIIEREINRGRADHQLYAVYGSLSLELGQLAKAESALRKSLEAAPEDANTLNNLAWLYATSQPPYSKPEAALELALRAAAIDPDPTILDTLAEAYYVNGQAEAALNAIRRALLKEPKNRAYFLSQEQKFEAAGK